MGPRWLHPGLHPGVVPRPRRSRILTSFTALLTALLLPVANAHAQRAIELDEIIQANPALLSPESQASKARAETPGMRVQPTVQVKKEGGPITPAFGYSVSYLPITDLPTEDVDIVEVMSAGAGPLAVWPMEGVVHFLDQTGPAPGSIIASIPTTSPNITGVDFVANSAGTFGAFATLGYLHLYDLTGPIPALVAVTALPGTPARRDIDPIIIDGAPGVVYATGTEIHGIAYPSGAILWTVPLPSPMVEAVDPVVNGPESRLFVPTEGFMTIYDISLFGATPGFLSGTFLATTLVREVDAQLAVGETYCYLPSTGSLFVFSTATGVLLTTLPLASPLIEGNDMEIDPTGTYGFLPTLAFMYQVDLGGLFMITHSFFGYVHQRNHDAIFTAPGVVPGRALYAVQGAVFIYDVAGAFVFSILPTPGTLIDGVDPATTDTPGPSPPIVFGATAVLSTLGYSHVINMLSASVISFPTPGVLRTDVDPKPGPLLGNRILQPLIGGLMGVEGFGPDDWIVTTATGLWAINIAAAGPMKFMPTPAMVYRGGDALPTTLLGPAEPPFSVDNPDQDFLTKCWEYKFAVNRWPYWWYHSDFAYYPRWVPFGVFGPPALLGYDLLNQVKVVVMRPGNLLGLLDHRGLYIQTINLPSPVIGGIIWDWDNKRCKVRMHGQLEAIVDLSPLMIGNLATVSFATFGARSRWYPIVDRMNGWEFLVQRGGRVVWVYDHLNGNLVTTIKLNSRCIRRPVFDEQRKTACFTLASRRCAFIDFHRYRVGLPNFLYYSPVLPAHIVGVPTFDLYNHCTILKLYGSQLAILNTTNGNVMWLSGPLPYWPVSPLQVDCYNKICKGFYRDFANHYELYLNLYPLAYGNPPLITWIPLAGQPYGYPLFDSKDGYELIRVGTNEIHWRSLFNPFAGGFVTTPWPIIGNLFVDRVNKYALCRLQNPGGGGGLAWIDLFKLTNGPMPGFGNIMSYSVAQFEEDVAFDTQGHWAAIGLDNGSTGFIDMQAGDFSLVTTTGFPYRRRQLYSHPFRHLINYPWYDGLQGGEVTFDLAGLRWSPSGGITFNIENTPTPPIEAEDFVPPPPPVPPLIAQMAGQIGDEPGIVHYELAPGTVEPGSIIRVVNLSTMETILMDEPNEDVAEDDGSGEISVVAQPGEVLSVRSFDAAGNASPEVFLNVLALDAPGAGTRAFAFAMVGENPVRDGAHFEFSLPGAERVELAIFDISGRKMGTIVDRALPAGTHSADWDLSDGREPVAAGVYFARIRAGMHEATARLLVIR